MRRRAPNPRDYDSTEDYLDAVDQHYGSEDRDDALAYEEREAEAADRARGRA